MQDTANNDVRRQIVLDTETTGLEHQQGHRIIEVGCVEVINRRLTGNNFHKYLNPQREVDEGAYSVHGLSNEFLADKPLFTDIVDQFLSYISGAELIIHNARFDVGFLDAELERLDYATPTIGEICGIHDTLLQARKLFPGQKNDLDSLCKRYEINNTHRDLHGALLDAEILADVYLTMTGGQTDLMLGSAKTRPTNPQSGFNGDFSQLDLVVQSASEDELIQHQEWVEKLNTEVQGQCVYAKLQSGN